MNKGQRPLVQAIECSVSCPVPGVAHSGVCKDAMGCDRPASVRAHSPTIAANVKVPTKNAMLATRYAYWLSSLAMPTPGTRYRSAYTLCSREGIDRRLVVWCMYCVHQEGNLVAKLLLDVGGSTGCAAHALDVMQQAQQLVGSVPDAAGHSPCTLLQRMWCALLSGTRSQTAV